MGKPVYSIVRIYFDTGYNASIKHVITYNVILFYKNALLCKKSRIYRLKVTNKKTWRTNPRKEVFLWWKRLAGGSGSAAPALRGEASPLNAGGGVFRGALQVPGAVLRMVWGNEDRAVRDRFVRPLKACTYSIIHSLYQSLYASV